MRRGIALAALVIASAFPSGGQAFLGGPDIAEIANLITELDVEGARKRILEARVESAELALQRARLAIYTGDCDTAGATLATLEPSEQVNALGALARTCARAVAGALIVDDAERGLWIRLQDDADRALVPFITEVAVRAREAVERDIGTHLPRPLRLDLVRDLFTLSAVSGLPLEAAETTGTVAVARWGRVTMLSPRAAPHGYPWEDTLAHELTHLALSRATRDLAPLWLQEGLAKRSETRWRTERPFDHRPAPAAVARQALQNGESVGVDALGPSIAMLPSSRAASIAFAEVHSFIDYFIATAGQPALELLLVDLKGIGSRDADDAMRSTTGYDLAAWIARWQVDLLQGAEPEPEREPASVQVNPARDAARAVRLGDLLFATGELDLAHESYARAALAVAEEPAVRWRAGRTLLALDQAERAAEVLGDWSQFMGGHSGWFAVSGRVLKERGDPSEGARRLGLAIALHPLLEDAACEGYFRKPGQPSGEASRPDDPARRALCEAARKIPRE
jgi:hypothetical protein